MHSFPLIFLCRYEILHTLILGCSFITLREPCNTQRPRCDIAWFQVTNNLYHTFVLSDGLFNCLIRKTGINITKFLVNYVVINIEEAEHISRHVLNTKHFRPVSDCYRV